MSREKCLPIGWYVRRNTPKCYIFIDWRILCAKCQFDAGKECWRQLIQCLNQCFNSLHRNWNGNEKQSQSLEMQLRFFILSENIFKLYPAPILQSTPRKCAEHEFSSTFLWNFFNQLKRCTAQPHWVNWPKNIVPYQLNCSIYSKFFKTKKFKFWN